MVVATSCDEQIKRIASRAGLVVKGKRAGGIYVKSEIRFYNLLIFLLAVWTWWSSSLLTFGCFVDDTPFLMCVIFYKFTDDVMF